MRLIVNFVAFQVAWFACVLGGAHGRPWIGVAVTALIVALHLRLSARPTRELMLILFAGLYGAWWDGFLAGVGWLVYPSGTFAQWVAPSWIIAMWVAFATTINASLRPLRGRWLLAFALGAVGGPAASAVGAALGGVTFPDAFVAMAVLAAGWSFIIPVLVYLGARLDGYAPEPTTPAAKEARARV
jgi:hypothetical protein